MYVHLGHSGRPFSKNILHAEIQTIYKQNEITTIEKSVSDFRYKRFWIDTCFIALIYA